MQKILAKVRTDGWKSLLPEIRWHLETVYRRSVLHNRFVAHLFPFRQPPILLLSYPRSGSSWVGDILAASSQIAYLFEPVTGPYQKHYGGPALADLNDPVVQRAYRQYSRDAFRGMPPKERYFHENLQGFSLPGRRRRYLLIKEVNPYAAEFYWQGYHPKILFLVRHPAAVALSFWNMGWLAQPDVQREAVQYEGDAWEKFGYSYGVVIKNALDTLRRFSAPCEVLFYERLASDPYAEFKKIFDYLSIAHPDDYAAVIQKYCYTDVASQGYDTRRVSTRMVAKWKKELSPDTIDKIRNGYFRSGLDFYRSDEDWLVASEGRVAP